PRRERYIDSDVSHRLRAGSTSTACTRCVVPPRPDEALVGVASLSSEPRRCLRRASTGPVSRSPRESTMSATSNSTASLPFQPSSMTQAQLAAISYLARYSGATHHLYAAQLRHVELYIRHLSEAGLMDSSVNTMMHAVRGYFRFAHIDGIIGADPAVYARLPKAHRDESRTQGLDRLELTRFLQVAQTITVHHGALAYLLGINALRASEAAAVCIEDYTDHLRGHRVLHLVGKGNKPATMPLTVPVLRVLEACRGQRTTGPLVLRPLTGKPIDRRDVYRMVQRIAKAAQIP